MAYLKVALFEAGEGLDFQGEPLIREESMEMEASSDRRQDAAGKLDQTEEEEEEEEESPSTEQQTQEAEVGSTARATGHVIRLQA